MRASLNAQFYDPTTGAYFDGEGTTHQAQHASVYAAAHGVAPDAELARIANWLVSNTAAPVRVSANAAQWLLEALYRGGRADAALDIMTNRRPESWLSMIETWGATQTMEAWSPIVKSNTTFSHPWTSGPANVIARFLLGVRVVEPGGARVEIAPAPASLARASGTVRGLVGVDIEQSPRYRVSVDLPGNVVGTLRWPLAGYALADFEIAAPDGPPVAGVIDGDNVVVPLRPGRTTVTTGS
jgi:alpha-L-rhamnosidase